MANIVNKLRVHLFDQSIVLKGVVTIINCNLRVYRARNDIVYW